MPDHAPEEHHDDGAGNTADFTADGGGAGGEQDEVIIPRPRSPLDDSPVLDHPPPATLDAQGDGRGSATGSVEPDFRYDQTWLRGKRRRYHGHVERIVGTEGERLREDLAAAVRDLLDWAAQHDGLDGPESGTDAGGGGRT